MQKAEKLRCFPRFAVAGCTVANRGLHSPQLKTVQPAIAKRRKGRAERGLCIVPDDQTKGVTGHLSSSILSINTEEIAGKQRASVRYATI